MPDLVSPSTPSLKARVLLGFISLLLTLVLVEPLVRIFAPHPRHADYTTPEAHVGWTALPHFDGRASNMFGEYETTLHTNAEGFRDDNHPLQKTSDTLRIAFLGDSFTFAEQVEEQEMFVHITESLLNSKAATGTHTRVECMNFGMGGYDTQQELLCYQTFVRKYHPDIVILAIYVRNDFIGNAFYLTEENFSRPHFRLQDGKLVRVPTDTERMEKMRQEQDRKRRPRWYHHLQSYNALKHLAWEIQNRYFPDKFSKLDVFGRRPLSDYRYFAQTDNDPVIQEANALSTLLLRQMETEATRDGSHFLVVLLPSEENLSPEHWTDIAKLYPELKDQKMDFERPYNLVRQSLPGAMAEGRVLDLRPALKAAATAQPLFFRRDSHYTVAGQRVTGETIAAWLESWMMSLAISSSRK